MFSVSVILLVMLILGFECFLKIVIYIFEFIFWLYFEKIKNIIICIRDILLVESSCVSLKKK